MNILTLILRKINILLLIVILPLFVSAQEEASKEEAFYFEGSIFGDLTRNFSGGYKQRNAYLGIVDIGIGLKTESAGLWKGGEFYLQFENTHGATPTNDYVGDYQTFSNAEAGNNSCLYQLWYKQNWDRFSVLIGQHDLNADFVVSDFGGTFINSSFGIIPSVCGNVPVSIFPVNTLAAMVRFELYNKFGIQAAVYDGDPGDFESNPYSVKFHWEKDEGLMTIAELNYKQVEGERVIGNYKLGGYYHTAEFKDVNYDSIAYRGNSGLYLIADHMLLPEKDSESEGLVAFTMMGYAPGNQNEVDFFIGGGFHYHGLFPGRNIDDLAIAFGHASFNNEFVKLNHMLGNETVIELTYNLVAGNHLELQPDLQYIINTGGEISLGNSFIGLLRCSIAF